MKFAEKILEGPTQSLPSEDAWDELDKLNSDHPIEFTGYKSTMPDMTRLVKIDKAIYRVNVPGYFYRHIKNPSTTSSVASGLVIGRTPTMIDMFTTLCYGTFSKNGSFSGKHQLIRQRVGWDKWSSEKYRLDIENKSGGYITTTYQDKNNCIAVAIFTQIRIAEEHMNTLRVNYFVSEGSNGNGGQGNNMVPIVPGCGALAIDLPLHLKSTLGNVELDRNDVSIDNSRGYESGALDEANGTYVHWYHNDGDTGDEYYFAPCIYVGNNVKFLTKIRNVNKFFCYHIGVENGTPVEMTSEKQFSVLTYANPSVWTFPKTGYENPNKEVNGIVYNGHDNAFCACFANCFYGTSMEPRSRKFLAYEYKYDQVPDFRTVPYPFTNLRDSSDLIERILVFDPTVDGA